MQAPQTITSWFFIFTLLITTSFSTITPSCCNLMRGVTIGGYWDLDEKYYPKSVAYFEKLRQKYSALHNIPIILWDGPCADADTIYFSIKWIEKLEKGNKFYLDATEWILLHEAGHIHHNDMAKEGLINFGMIFSYYYCIYQAFLHYAWNNAYQSFMINSKVFKPTHQAFQVAVENKLKKTCEDHNNKFYMGAAIGVSFLTIKFLYLNATREYAADDFAMQHCDNPEAWIAAYEFLDRFAPLGFLPGILHSFTKYRLNRISTAFKEKFGYELVVIPQSLDPKFVD